MAETTKGAVRRDVDTGPDRDALVFDFGVDSFKLGTEHSKYLDELITFLEAPGTPPMTVSIDGFASHTGSAAHNQALSENREQAVENYLRAHSNVFDPGNPHTINRRFNGFSGSPPGENPLFRSVRIVVHKPGVIPPPKPLPPPTPTTPLSGRFQVDLIGWIPQPEVDNPLSLLPSIVTSLLPPGMADPFFGCDDFTMPATTPSGMVPPIHTFRATQHIDFTIGTWGAAPGVGSTSAVPGISTCLDKRRAAGGKVTFSLTATLLRASANVVFSKSDDWYEVTLSGVVLDPIPAAAAVALTSKLPGIPGLFRAAALKAISDLVTNATPSLTWDATLRIQNGSTLDPLVALTYVPFIGTEQSGTLSGASSALVPGTDLIHGKIHFSEWPSAVIFITFTPTGGALAQQRIFFSNGMGLPRPEPAFIEVPKLCKLRTLTW